MTTLFQFTHCPYCIRVSMALGYLQIPFESRVTRYDDKETPMRLIGKKTLPVIQFSDGSAMGESLDIIQKLDASDKLGSVRLRSELEELTKRLTSLGDVIHPLAIPYWIKFPEFDDASREYFLNKQTAKRGSLGDIVASKQEKLDQLYGALEPFEPYFRVFHRRMKVTIIDIVLAAHLWPLEIVDDGAHLDANVASYLSQIGKACKFSYRQHISGI